jgi:hypothetical protein
MLYLEWISPTFFNYRFSVFYLSLIKRLSGCGWAGLPIRSEEPDALILVFKC